MSIEDEVEHRILERLAAGEFGVVALAKAEAVDALVRIVIIAKDPDDKQQFAANRYLIELAGIQPPTPKVIETPERVLDKMSAEEMHRFARDGVVPDHLIEDFAKIASASLAKTP